MSDPLLPCPSCARHVRVAEVACPFCHTSLPRIEAAPVSTQPLRVNRATLFAFGASLAVAGCASPPVPLYGAPAVDVIEMDTGADAGPPDTGTDAGFDAGPADRGNIQPMYGSPPDAGVDAEADASADTGPDVEASTAGPYGAPPWPDGF